MTRWFLVALCLASAAHAQPTDSVLFRQIFAAAVQPGSNDQLNHLIYAPTAGLLDENAYFNNRCQLNAGAHDSKETIARGELCKMTEVFKGLDARALFNQGASLTAAGSTINADQLKTNLASRDLLIVVVPGIFGEFIQKRAFEEIFEKDSAFQREWKSTFTAKSSGIDCTSNAGNAVCDEQDKLQRLNLDPNNQGGAQIPMSDLLNVGSIDGADGKPLVRVILFQMDGMTLESLGAQQNNAAIFNRRLEKFFQIMNHTPKDIAFVGYSRGTDYALEMLAQAKAQNKPWLANVKALVSLGGVVFGSALADDAVTNKSSKLNRQLQLADIIKRFLTPLPETNKTICEGNNLQWLGKNMLGWYKVANAFVELQNEGQPPAQTPEDQIEKLLQFIVQTSENRGGPDPAFAVKLLTAELMKFGLFTEEDVQARLGELTTALRGLALNDFGPMIKFIQSQDPCRNHSVPNTTVTKYNTDIRRFKKLITAAVQGVTELSTDSRLAWWRTHTIPLNVHYYSVSGTMADPSTDLGNNRWTLNPGSPDDTSLIQNWRDFQKVDIGPEYAGVNLNDSQMAIYKTVFWPKMIESLNPANAGIRSTPLGIVGTHHWGLALPIVTQVQKFGPDQGGLMTVNPFPRTELMESIALSIANDLSADDQAESKK